MTVMNASAAGALSGEDQTAQSIAVILTTPVGSRVCRRDFGSDLPDLIDQPMNVATRQKLLGATALALARWKPDVVFDRVLITKGASDGAWTVELDRRGAAGATSRLTVPLSF